MTATLVLHGHCPSKKNLWKRGRGGHTYIDSETAALIDALTVQARAQWKHEPVTHPDMCVQFFARDRRRDRDNTLATILDCLDVVVYLAPRIRALHGRIWFGAGMAVNAALAAKQRRNFLRFLNRHGLSQFQVLDDFHRRSPKDSK